MRASGPRIVVVGGGFGGLYAASYLARSDLMQDGASITLVDQRHYFTFTPLLAEVAAGTLGREHVVYPYRALGRRYGFQFVQDRLCELDIGSQIVRTQHVELDYDYLVLALGAEPRYFGNDQLRENSLPLTSVGDALAVRDHVINMLERATMTPDETQRRALLTFVVAGAGPAGVEVASEIHHLANEVVRPYYDGLPPARVVIVDRGPRILAAFDERLAADGLERLRGRGIDVRLERQIAGVRPGIITASNGHGTETIEAETLIWTAGTAPVSLAAALDVPTDGGAIRIGTDLRVDGLDNVFAVGDVTSLVDERSGRPYPRVAPIAISQGVRAAANIENMVLGRPLEPYRAYHAGKIVALGSGLALVDILGIRFTGLIAWWIYRLVYLLKLVGTKNKVRVLLTLALNRIFEPDVTAR